MRRASASGWRPRRVAEAVRETVTDFLREEARDPRIGMVTITDVEVSGDLQHAIVRFVVHGDAKEREDTLEGLTNAVPAVRRRLGGRLRLRLVPELVFEPDLAQDHAQRIETLLAKLRRQEDPPP